MSVPSAVDVLETRIGDCNEHAILAVALLRAAGIPARMAVGVLYFEERFYYHAWVEAFWGRWLAVDPILGQVPADATHIRFMTGGLDRQMEMVRVIGRLRVEVLEAR
jgi:transglutaminase-like putative cysteine protease